MILFIFILYMIKHYKQTRKFADCKRATKDLLEAKSTAPDYNIDEESVVYKNFHQVYENFVHNADICSICGKENLFICFCHENLKSAFEEFENELRLFGQDVLFSRCLQTIDRIVGPEKQKSAYFDPLRLDFFVKYLGLD